MCLHLTCTAPSGAIAAHLPDSVHPDACGSAALVVDSLAKAKLVGPAWQLAALPSAPAIDH